MHNARGNILVFGAVGLVLTALAMVAFIRWLIPVSFCDIALALDVAVDAGEDVYRAMESFYADVSDAMVASLPDELRGLAEALVAVVDALLSAPRVLASLVFDRLDPALDAMAAACRI